MPVPQFIIFAYCILSAFIASSTNLFSASYIIMVVTSIILSSLSYFFLNKYFTLITSGIYAIISFAAPTFITMLPLILYNVAYFQGYHKFIIIIIFIASLLYNCIPFNALLFFTVLLGMATAYYIQFIQERYNKLLSESHKIRDATTENNIILHDRNKALLEKQDYEIYNATLKERNRIAREIHDNVGHLLSRSILLTGVLETVNKDNNCTELLDNLHNSLDTAMESIRASVHNLHDDSISLKDSVDTIINNFKFCKTNVIYDMGTDVPREVKFAFIAILKEGLNNICKHSNATDVHVLLREHPAMYQLIIKDNGTNVNNINISKYMHTISANSGMGIANIYSRVNMLGGSLQIHTDNGFCIFITAPKT